MTEQIAEVENAPLPRIKASRRPLAPTTYLIRNLGKATPLVGVVLLAVLLIAGIVSMMESIPLSIRTIYSYSKRFAGVTPRGDQEALPRIRSIIEKESPVPIGRILVVRASGATVKSIVGKWPFVIIGLTPGDLHFFLNELGAKNLRGKLPEPGQPEAVISEPIARNLNLKLGSLLARPDDPQAYSPFPIKVVGIVQTPEWLMANDIEYQRAHHFPDIDNLLVFTRNASDQDRFDRWSYRRFKGERAQVLVHFRLEEETADMFSILYRILDVVIATLVLVITLMMGMLMNIYQGQRLVEFGLLQAIGYTRKQILRRVFAETFIVLGGGWLLGVLVAFGLLHLFKATLMDPNAFSINPLEASAYLYTLPVPIAVLIAASLTVFQRFRKFDPVAVIERRLV